MERAQDFFAFARERHSIYLRRKAGSPRSEWTSDPILSTYRFTNVFRELDATTIWFRENVRDPLRDSPDVLLATVLFRWFNRVKTGEAIFLQKDILGGDTAWDMMREENYSTDALKYAIRSYCGRGPYVTGAYIIKTPNGMDKLSGVLKCVEWFMEQEHDGGGSEWGWRDLAQLHKDESGCNDRLTLEAMWNWLRQFPYLGDFMAYELVTDLRHTALLENAPDIMTWANPGPGAMRGLNRLQGRDLKKRLPKDVYIQEMRDLLELSQDSKHWPQAGSIPDSAGFALDYVEPDDWPALEMREIEHTLCEFDKMERVRLGEGRPRGVYR